MNPFVSVRVALRALAGKMLRTVLTMLGVIIGVGAVVALMSIGQGSQAQITSQIQSLGTNLLFVRPGSTSQQGVRTGAGQAPTLTLNDAEAIAELPTVVDVASEAGGFGQLVAGGQNWNSRILGVSTSYASVRNLEIASGEWLSEQQADAHSSVVVLGSTVVAQIFGDSDPIGQTVRISMFGRTGSNFRVIGVTKPKGASMFGDQDDDDQTVRATRPRWSPNGEHDRRAGGRRELDRRCRGRHWRPAAHAPQGRRG
jgi:putative ABC transport system permease protein